MFRELTSVGQVMYYKTPKRRPAQSHLPVERYESQVQHHFTRRVKKSKQRRLSLPFPRNSYCPFQIIAYFFISIVKLTLED